ncbi:MAG: amidophosphoribosyltransferase [Alphaproteobacteria bacterium]|nr:amidophosphoribosyltransferase [Alphaproteobacteria bacterium]
MFDQQSHDDEVFDDHFHDNCAVFGVHNNENAAELIALGLHALQHRGQEASGVATADGVDFHFHRALGLVGDIFSTPDVMQLLRGKKGIGHNRYPTTTRDSGLANIQPLYANLTQQPFALAHNGHLTNHQKLRESLPNALFASAVDTELILHLAAQAGGSVENRLISALGTVEGAWALVVLTQEALYGIRDPLGIRPLSLAKFIEGNGYVLTSETCANDLVNAHHVRDVAPGEMIRIDDDGVHSSFPWRDAMVQVSLWPERVSALSMKEAVPAQTNVPTSPPVPSETNSGDGTSPERAVTSKSAHPPKRNSAHCVFEFIYFSRPDSHHAGFSVYDVRKEIGRQLAIEQPAEVDIISPVPDSGVVAALGFAEQSGITYDQAIIRNHYVGRTFIEPASPIRHLGVKLKHSANRSVVEGKRVLLVDDSIVRGTTAKKIVALMRQAGAIEVHMRISSPPTKFSCHYGVDTPEDDQLLARTHGIEAVRDFIGVDSLGYLSREGLYRAFLNQPTDPFGDHPAPDGRASTGDARDGKGSGKGDAKGGGKTSLPGIAERFCDACFSGNYPVAIPQAAKNTPATNNGAVADSAALSAPAAFEPAVQTVATSGVTP